MQTDKDPYEPEQPEEVFSDEEEEPEAQPQEPVPHGVPQVTAGEDAAVSISVADLAYRIKSMDAVSCLLFGQRRVGKSFFLRWLLYYLTLLGKEYDAVFVFSGTAMNNQFNMVSRKFQWEKWDTDSAKVVEEIFQRQHDIVQHNSECSEESEMRKVPAVAIIFDDVFHSGDGALYHGFKSEMMSKIWFQGRHYNISAYLLVQSFKAMSRIRSNSDFLISFFPASHIIRKELRDNHLTIESTTPESVRAAERFMMKTWQGKHAAQVIDLASSAGRTRLSEFVYQCTAPPDEPPLFGMGHESHWQVDATNM